MASILQWRPTALQTLSIMVFLGQMQNYMMRGNLSILIVAMVEDPDNKSLHWDEWERGLVLSGFAYGYLVPQIIGGRMAELFGIKKIYGISIFLSGLCTFATPTIAKWNFPMFFALRVLLGLCEGATFPAVFVISARWVPPLEQNRFMAKSMFGHCVGMSIMYPLCGYLTHYFGWESAFYTIGAISSVWFIGWWFLIFDTPLDHPHISQQEQERLTSKVSSSSSGSKRSLPWRGMLTSLPLLGLYIADLANKIGWQVFYSNGPSYMKFVLGADIRKNGILSGLPMIMRYVGGVVHSYIADLILAKKYMSLVNVRRLFAFTSLGLPSIGLVFMAFYSNTTTNFVVLQMVVLFFNGSVTSSYISNFVDIAPDFVGTVFGMCNFINGGFVNTMVPTLIGALTFENMTESAWKIIFLSAGGAYFLGFLGYTALVSGEKQPWNDIGLEKEEGGSKPTEDETQV